MAIGDDDVVQNLHAEKIPRLGQFARRRFILSAGCGFPGRMIVADDDRNRSDKEGDLKHLARMHRATGRRAGCCDRISNNLMGGIEMQRDKMFP